VGRFALRVEEPLVPTQAVQGGFTWRDAQGRLELDLTNPFGNILARIEVTGKRAVLTQNTGSKLEAATPEELVKIAVGEAIPVQGLRTWLRNQTVADHQPPNALLPKPAARGKFSDPRHGQRLYPQCDKCRAVQGGTITGNRLHEEWFKRQPGQVYSATGAGDGRWEWWDNRGDSNR
jgi:hypothetical protein